MAIGWTVDESLSIVAQFEVYRRGYLAPDGTIIGKAPAFDLNARDLRTGLDRMRADAEARSIPPEQLRGASITLSNFGMIGGRFANLIVVPPQVAIIGAGRIAQRVMVHQGQPAERRVLPLSLTFDHRVVTGGEAARFLVALKSDLEQP